MRLQHLFDQVDAVEVADAQLDDRQIARNAEAPQPGLPQPVAGDDVGRGAAQGIAVNDGTGQAAKDLGIGFGDAEVTQHLLALEPGHFERTLDEVAVAIFIQQGQSGLARVRDPGDDLHDCRFVGRQGQGAADRHDGIQHRAIGVRQGRRSVATIQHHRVGRRATASDEAGAVGLVRRCVGHRTGRGQQVEHPGHLLARRAGAPRAEDRLTLGQDFGLHEQIAERAMRQIRIQRRQHHFRVARHLDAAGARRLVGEGDAADFDVILGGHGDLGVRLDRLIAPPVFGARLYENCLVVIGTAQRGLMRRRPVFAAVGVAQVDEGAPAVGGGVLAPAGDGKVAPAAGAAAGVGRHDVVAAVRQQMHFG